MNRSEKNKKAMSLASKNLDEAMRGLYSSEYKDVPEVEKNTWVMAMMIRCDITRLAVFLDECEAGVISLLTMADIVSKLYEAQLWFFNDGTKALIEIAKTKPCGSDYVSKRLKELKGNHRISEINKYNRYRNTIGFHYDKQAPQYLYEFGNENLDNFKSVLTAFVYYSYDWASLAMLVIKDRPSKS